MSNFTSYFIAIPLQPKYYQEFSNTLTTLKDSMPEAHIVQPTTPHITLFYLTKSIETEFAILRNIISKHLPLLNGQVLSVKGLGYFRGDDPKVVFLDVIYPNEIKLFFDQLQKDLAKYSATDNDFPFHPHLTLANLKTDSSKTDFRNKQHDLQSSLFKVKWTFEINKLVLYGTDSQQIPEHQEIIETFNIN